MVRGSKGRYYIVFLCTSSCTQSLIKSLINPIHTVKQVTHFICVLKFQDWSFAVVNTMLPSSLGKNSPVWYIPNLEEAKGLIQALDPNNQEVELVPGEPLSTNSPPLH